MKNEKVLLCFLCLNLCLGFLILGYNIASILDFDRMHSVKKESVNHSVTVDLSDFYLKDDLSRLVENNMSEIVVNFENIREACKKTIPTVYKIEETPDKMYAIRRDMTEISYLEHQVEPVFGKKIAELYVNFKNNVGKLEKYDIQNCSHEFTSEKELDALGNEMQDIRDKMEKSLVSQ